LARDFTFSDSDGSRLFIDGLFEERRRSVLKRVLFFFVYSSLLLLFCTKNSPLYVFNDWPDPNIYMSVGRAVSSGAVLYRDVFEQKGPLFLLLFSLLSAITPYSMLSLYFVQCISLTASLEILCRTARLYLPASPAIKISLIFPIFLLNYMTYYQGGGSAEELMLPMFLSGMYFLLRYYSKKADAGTASGELSLPVFFVMGIFSGVTALVKISLSPFLFCITGMIALDMLISRKRSALCRSLLMYVAGILTAALPCLIYIWMTNSFSDVWKTYILFNMGYAGAQTPTSLSETVITLSALNLFSVLLIVVTWISVLGGTFRLTVPGKIAAALSMAVISIMVVIPCRPYSYVFIPFLALAGVGQIGLVLLARKYRNSKMPASDHQSSKIPASDQNTICLRVPIAAVVIFVFAAVIAANALLPESRLCRKEKTGIETIAETIRQSWDQEKNPGDPNILIYGAYDNGLFDLARTRPMVKYFQMPVISGTTQETIFLEQETYISGGIPDYVVTIGYKGEPVIGIVDTINEDYEIIGFESADSQRCDLSILLYKRK
jgi:hypothetical protein